MIVPITICKNGENENVGTASVEFSDGVISVDFYLSADYTISDKVKVDMEKQLRNLARQHPDHLEGFSID